ncbi:MAG: hypothetical protein IJ151_03705 [Bacteroidales bacterium]|nr:hypothetical protein [Bacteroidales bacterium]
MKKIFIAFVAAAMLVACGGGPKTPADQLCSLLDEGAAFLLAGNKDADDVFEDKFEALFDENADYVLTEADKDKIIDKFSDLMDDALDAAIKNKQIPEEMLDLAKGQMSQEIDEMKAKLDKAETFGDLKKIFD